METPILSILIATLPSREANLKALLRSLYIQCGKCIALDEVAEKQLSYGIHDFGNVEIITALDNKQITVGAKRQKLLNIAKGEYVCFIDDDDTILDGYIPLILKACESKPDCIGFDGYITTNRANKQLFEISKDFKTWYTKDNIHYRTPNHLSPVKRNIAILAGFQDKQKGEDAAYSNKILPMLNTEVKINEQLYYYNFDTTKTETQ